MEPGFRACALCIYMIFIHSCICPPSPWWRVGDQLCLFKKRITTTRMGSAFCMSQAQRPPTVTFNGSRIICSCGTLPTSYPAIWLTVCYSTNVEIGHIFGAFAKLLNATVSFVVSFMSVPSLEQLRSHWRDFHEILYLGVLRTSMEKIQV